VAQPDTFGRVPQRLSLVQRAAEALQRRGLLWREEKQYGLVRLTEHRGWRLGYGCETPVVAERCQAV